MLILTNSPIVWPALSVAAFNQDTSAVQVRMSQLENKVKQLVAEETNKRDAEFQALKTVLASIADRQVIEGVTRRQYIDLLQRIQDVDRVLQKNSEDLALLDKKLEKLAGTTEKETSKNGEVSQEELQSCRKLAHELRAIVKQLQNIAPLSGAAPNEEDTKVKQNPQPNNGPR